MEPSLSFSWDGWVCAYVSINGFAFNAYVGKRSNPESANFGAVSLEDAFEYTSIVQPKPGGAFERAFLGAPIEFSPIGKIVVRPVALLELDALKGDALRPFATARKDAFEKLRNMTKGAPLIEQASRMPPLNGTPLVRR